MITDRPTPLKRTAGGGLLFAVALLIGSPPQAAPSATAAPTTALRLERFGAREGLPAETINALLIDRIGLLWIATREGLFSFDGYTFTPYVHDIAEPDSLVDNWVRTLWESNDGTLWLGTNTGGLARFDRAAGRFRSFRHDPSDPTTLSHDSIYTICGADDGQLWVGTQRGLNRFDPRSGRAERVPLLPTGSARSGSEYVASLAADSAGRLWIATIGDGVLRRDRDGTIGRLPIAPGDPRALHTADAFSLAIDPHGAIWIGTRHGAAVHTPDDGSVTRVSGADAGLAEVEDTVVPAISVDPRGTVWLATFHGVYPVTAPARAERRIVVGRPAEVSSRGDQATAITASPDGTIWVGTVGAGLQRLTPPAGPFSVITSESPAPTRLGYDDVTALFEAEPGIVYIGSFGAGLDRWDRRSGTITRIPLAPADLRVGDGVERIARDHRGRIWVGATDGLHCYDPRTGLRRSYLHADSDPTTLRGGYVFGLLCDRRGRLWVGTGGGGLHRLRDDESGFVRYPLRSDDPQSPSDDFITVLHETDDGWLWVGTRSGGLYRFDPQRELVARVPVDPRDPSALPHHYVTAIVRDRRDRLWVATAGGGLTRVTGSDSARGPRFTRITARDGLADDNVMALADDDEGHLWIATRRGFTHYDPDDGRAVSYDTADGLPSSEGNLSAALSGSDAIYIGTMKGLVVIPRRAPLPASEPTPLTLTALRAPAGLVVAPDSRWPPEKISIRHRQFLALEFAVVDFDLHRRHRYAFRLSEDAPWVDLGHRREVTFTDLAPGTHRLELRGRGARGAWSEPPLVLRVQVIPPFYRTNWFRIAAVLGLLGALLTWHRVRTYNLKRRNRELTALQVQREAALQQAQQKEAELQSAFDRLRQLTRRLEAAKEEERQRIARELHDEMGQLLTAAKISVQLLQRTPGEAHAERRLADLVGLLDRMIQLVRTLSFELRPPLMDELGLIAALRGHLEALAQRSGLVIRFRAPAAAARMPLEVDVAAFRIVQEALTNVLRHADAHAVDVTLRWVAGRIEIEVRDDGRGFDPRAVSGGEDRIGLRNMQERAQALGGEFRIESRPGAGTVVRAELPWSD